MSDGASLLCLECGADLQIDAAGPGATPLAAGEILICPSCGAEMEVLRPAPPELRVVTEDDD